FFQYRQPPEGKTTLISVLYNLIVYQRYLSCKILLINFSIKEYPGIMLKIWRQRISVDLCRNDRLGIAKINRLDLQPTFRLRCLLPVDKFFMSFQTRVGRNIFDELFCFWRVLVKISGSLMLAESVLCIGYTFIHIPILFLHHIDLLRKNKHAFVARYLILFI